MQRRLPAPTAPGKIDGRAIDADSSVPADTEPAATVLAPSPWQPQPDLAATNQPGDPVWQVWPRFSRCQQNYPDDRRRASWKDWN